VGTTFMAFWTGVVCTLSYYWDNVWQRLLQGVQSPAPAYRCPALYTERDIQCRVHTTPIRTQKQCTCGDRYLPCMGDYRMDVHRNMASYAMGRIYEHTVFHVGIFCINFAVYRYLFELEQVASMFIKLYLVAFPIFLIVDMLWLGLVSKSFYQKHIGFLMKSDVNWHAAMVFYLLFIGGLVTFVVVPAVEKQSSLNALLFGALFGLVTYATYDLTNLATLKHWPSLVTIIDLAWGTTLSALVSSVTYIVSTRLGIN
jgi:uncharacterized membrane protein